MIEGTQNSVECALDEILGIESDRVRAEDEERRVRLELEARRLLDEERRRREETRAREEAAARRRAEAERSAVEEEAQQAHRRRLEEIRVRQEAEGRLRLAEEELRLRHERELAAFEVAKRRLPWWGWATIAGLVVLGAVAGVLPYLQWQDAEEALVAARAESERDRIAREDQLGAQRSALRDAQAERSALLAAIAESRQMIERARAELAQAAGDRARLAEIEAENRRLREDLAALEGTCRNGGPTVPRPRPPRNGGPAVAPPRPTVERCLYRDTPMEQCFSCPGDPRC